MSTVLTKEILIDAIQKSKATSISGVWKHLGHKSAISGSQGKKIRELVPNHLELFEANKKGITIAASKTAQPLATTVKMVKTVKTAKTPKAKGAGGFREGSHYAILFAEGNKGYTTMAELIAKVAKLTNRPEKLVKFDYYVMSNKTHKSNGGRAMIDTESVPGKVKIVAQN
jgi:hypothetical protein